MTIEWMLLIVIAIIGFIVQARLQSVFTKYSRVPMENGLTGREVAEKMLRDNGIYDVQVISTSMPPTALLRPPWLPTRRAMPCRMPASMPP